MEVAVIINPLAGTTPGRPAGAARAALARAVLREYGIAGRVHLTDGPGHARELAARALDQGSTLVIAWGGDGTVNEVGAAVAFRDAALGIVPGGSGNGLARALGLSRRPARAMEVALTGAERLVDAGELDGRLFFNVAGVGFDAHVARLFARRRARGPRGYIVLTLRELFRYRPATYRVTSGEWTWYGPALLVAVANGPEFGNGARIAPGARLDDGLLDLVVVEARSVLAALWELPRLYAGTVHRAPGVILRRLRQVTLASEGALPYHVDGETGESAAEVRVRVRPAALRVRVPRETEGVVKRGGAGAPVLLRVSSSRTLSGRASRRRCGGL